MHHGAHLVGCDQDPSSAPPRITRACAQVRAVGQGVKGQLVLCRTHPGQNTPGPGCGLASCGTPLFLTLAVVADVGSVQTRAMTS